MITRHGIGIKAENDHPTWGPGIILVREDGFLTDQMGFPYDRESVIDFALETLKLYSGITPGQLHQINDENWSRFPSQRGDMSSPETPPPTRNVKAGHVYLMHNGTYYKIGITTGNPESRRAAVENASGIPTKLVCYFPVEDPRMAEQILHDKFAEYRQRGEWFDLPQEALDLFKTIAEEGHGEWVQE